MVTFGPQWSEVASHGSIWAKSITSRGKISIIIITTFTINRPSLNQKQYEVEEHRLCKLKILNSSFSSGIREK